MAATTICSDLGAQKNKVRHCFHCFPIYFPLSDGTGCLFMYAAAAAAKSLQSCLTLCDPIDGSPLGSSVPGILQARILEWVAISFSNGWKWKVKVKLFSRAWLLATPWTAAHQAPPSMGFSRQEYWSGLPLPSPLFMYTTPSYFNYCSFKICLWFLWDYFILFVFKTFPGTFFKFIST